MSEIVLVHYNPKKPLILSTDASDVGLGACLSQIVSPNDERPIAFASRTCPAAKKNYSVMDREACAIYFGVRKFEQFVTGIHFMIKTDHNLVTNRLLRILI